MILAGRHVLALGAAMMAVALTCGSAALRAQDIVEAEPPEPFHESYDPNANVSGGQLVGLRIGPSQQDPTGPLFVSLATPATKLCVSAISQDGRYLATNPFGVPTGGATPTVRISSISRQYVTELARYASDDIAIRMFVESGASCDPGEALNTPYASSPAGGNVLQVLANARAFGARAKLEADGVLIADVRCERLGDDARIAYDTICRLPLPVADARTGQLTLLFNDGFSDTPYSYRVLIPRVVAP